MTDHTTHDVENERHRAECAECQALWTELDAISAEASQLPLLRPSRDLWQGIEARIAAPRVLPFHQKPAFRMLMAASLLIAVTSGVTWRLATRTAQPELPAATVAVSEPNSPESVAADLTAANLTAVSGSVTQMDREIAALQALVRERRGELDPATVTVLERNLAVIDAAITEARAALEADPNSTFIAQQVARAYTSKLTLLRGAAQLPAGL